MPPAKEKSNRRKWERVTLGGEVVGRIHTVAAAPVLDLSENGALLEVPCSLRPGTLYALRLLLGPGRQLGLRCRVVRSYIHGFEPKTGGESMVKYRAAVEFVDLQETERTVIQHHLGRAEGILEEEFE